LKDFAQLTHRGQARRLRVLAQAILRHYPLQVKRVRLLAYHFNAIFRVDSEDGDKFVLRINIPGGRTLGEIRSEMAWLAALRRETDLVVPEPLPSREGSLVTTVETPGVPEPRHCVIFGWVAGRDLFHHLTPENYFKLGIFTTHLHDHAGGFVLPDGCRLKRLDKVLPFNHGEVIFTDGGHELLAPGRLEIFRETAARVRETLEILYDGRDGERILHADLHQGNIRVNRGGIGALDFDDSMLGYPVQDIGITFYYIQNHPEYPALREAFQRGYESRLAWPEEAPGQIETLIAWRELQLLNFLLGSDNPMFEKMLPDFVARAEGRLRRFLDS